MLTAIYIKSINAYFINDEEYVVKRSDKCPFNWVFKKINDDNIIDTDQYRYDLFERNNIKIVN